MAPLERVAALADQLRQADQEADRLRDELRQAILEAHREGKSLREIARAAGISSTRVHQIVHESVERVPGGVLRPRSNVLWGRGYGERGRLEAPSPPVTPRSQISLPERRSRARLVRSRSLGSAGTWAGPS